jgi:lipoprotein
MKHLVLTLVSVFVFVSCGNNKSITETDPETGYKYERLKEEYNKPDERIGYFVERVRLRELIDKEKRLGGGIIEDSELAGIIKYEDTVWGLPEIPFRVTSKTFDEKGELTFIDIQNVITGEGLTFQKRNPNMTLKPKYVKSIVAAFEDKDVGEIVYMKTAIYPKTYYVYFPVTDDLYLEMVKSAL